ncbi:MAG: M1 family aminopeptidase, partial [Bacteroidota bacterium]
MRRKISVRIFYTLLLSIVCSVNAPCSVSDSLHVIHYNINIENINFTLHTIKASCSVTIQAKQNNVSAIPLSLLELTVDSVKINGSSMVFSYNDTTLIIPAPSPMQLNDSLTADIYYHGAPVTDASGWGGFYFSSTHAFNMGIGFAADPHNYGKAWFPCIDEFTDHSIYDFYITTASNHKAFCNGILAGSVVNPNNTVTWHWQMNQPIASYLASIAVSNYYTLKCTSNNINIEWACTVSDTPAVLNTFQHVDTILSSFITAYGPYPFDKVGFILVPFNSGAMEHATSIHIGTAYMSGLTYETIWAHELSHMWWGDKVTCETAGDMWLNEGFASFNEAFMTEKVYGAVAYKNWLRINNKLVLQFAHIVDGNYLPLINVPHDYT